MKDPLNGELLIVGDGSQGLYKRNKVSWKQLGIQASGRTQYLHQNYRNTRPIIALATRFANKSGESDEDGLIAPLVDPNKCIRLAGVEAVLLTKKSKTHEVDRVVKVVAELLKGQWFGESIPPLKPEQIGILYRMDHGFMNGLRENLKRIKGGCPVIWLTEKGKNAKGRFGEPGVKILTMHSSKGLQFKAVILLFADDCPADFPDTTEEEERCLFYVALTRAEDYLAISCSKKSKFIEEICQASASEREVESLADADLGLT
jgi:superfamily I DNA/RNA helicase